jgi:hypothetical protein
MHCVLEWGVMEFSSERSLIQQWREFDELEGDELSHHQTEESW